MQTALTFQAQWLQATTLSMQTAAQKFQVLCRQAKRLRCAMRQFTAPERSGRLRYWHPVRPFTAGLRQANR